VTIVDSHGTLLSNGFSQGKGQPADRLELKRTVEAYLEDKAQTLLNGVLGPGKSVVRISADLNLERIERSVERYDPESAVIRSEERSENNDGEGGGRSETSVTNYEFDRTVESIAGEVGNIERLSVAVMVDGTYDTKTDARGETTKTFVARSDEEIAKISNIVKSAVGFDPKRHDYFEIASIAFDRSYLEEAERGMDKMLRLQFYLSIARKAAFLGGIILGLILILKLVKKAAGILGAARTGIDIIAGGSNTSVGAAADLAPVTKAANDIASRIANIAAQNPNQAAEAISSMVEQEK
jgi:flagellar M-ring protein FliF